jgi:hypothetical protein
MVDDKVYKIGVYIDDIKWPKRCLCCFEKPDNHFKVTCFSALNTFVDKDKTQEFSVPYCSDCLKHIESQKPSNRIVLGGAIIGILFLFMHLWIPAIVIIVLSIIIALVVSSKKHANGDGLKDSCSGYNEAITYYGFKNGRHLFNFHNEQYAKAFLRLNSDDPDITYDVTNIISDTNNI